ncbi:MAG: hypothetical protein WCY22_03925 [Acholeplasmataceae bacterium]
MLINLSNHPVENWSAKQTLTATLQFGEIIDLSFPQIPPDWDSDKIGKLANDYFHKCYQLLKNKKLPYAVHLAGEPVFCFILAQQLLKANIRCISSTTERIAVEENGMKVSEFRFKRFRDYLLL